MGKLTIAITNSEGTRLPIIIDSRACILLYTQSAPSDSSIGIGTLIEGDASITDIATIIKVIQQKTLPMLYEELAGMIAQTESREIERYIMGIIKSTTIEQKGEPNERTE